MPNLSKKDIKKLVGNGDTENALELLLTSLSEENKNYNKFTLLKGQWATAQEQIRLGLENRKTVDLVFNRITDATLSLVEVLSDTDLKSTQNKHNTREEIQKISNLNSINYQYDIFFSFSSKDIDEAKELCNQLRGYGLRVFFSADDMRLKGGHQFSEVIDEALENSCHFLLHCTPNSMVSEWVKVEYTTFHDQIYISDRKNRRFLILEGINFDEKLLRISYRNIQRVNNVNDILNILLPFSLKDNSDPKTKEEKERQAKIAEQKRIEEEKERQAKIAEQKRIEEEKERQRSLTFIRLEENKSTPPRFFKTYPSTIAIYSSLFLIVACGIFVWYLSPHFGLISKDRQISIYANSRYVTFFYPSEKTLYNKLDSLTISREYKIKLPELLAFDDFDRYSKKLKRLGLNVRVKAKVYDPKLEPNSILEILKDNDTITKNIGINAVAKYGETIDFIVSHKK